MPRKARTMSALEVKRLKHPGQGTNVNVAVGGTDGLLLQLTPTGAKSWILRCVVGSKRRHIGLGGYPEVGLAEAREDARELRKLVRQGIDPIEDKRQRRAALRFQQEGQVSFQEATERFLIAKLSEFSNPKHQKQWRSTLTRHAFPSLGRISVSDIGVLDVKRALEPIWETKTETASRLRGRIEAVLAWATVSGYRTGDNPARWQGNLDAVLPKPSAVSKVMHHPALPVNQAPEWFQDLRERGGTATRALEFLALTAARSGEVRGATWDEFDLSEQLWTIPAERMKANKQHRVALPKRAMALVTSQPRLVGSPLVFAAPRGGQLSDASIGACMRRIQERKKSMFLDTSSKRPAVPHGIRSTFRDWAADRTEYPRDMVEIALAHSVGTEVERAYRRTDMLAKRRFMMDEWERFLTEA